MDESSPLNVDGYLLRPADESRFAFAMACMEESVLASVSAEEASRAEGWMGFYRNLVSMHFDGAGMRNSLFILEHDGEPAGILWMGVGADQFTGEDTGYVLGIQVAPSHRGRGLGKAMLDWAERWCLDEGLSTLSLNVSPRNLSAKRLYESHGFQPHSLVMRRDLR